MPTIEMKRAIERPPPLDEPLDERAAALMWSMWLTSGSTIACTISGSISWSMRTASSSSSQMPSSRRRRCFVSGGSCGSAAWNATSSCAFFCHCSTSCRCACTSCSLPKPKKSNPAAPAAPIIVGEPPFQMSPMSLVGFEAGGGGEGEAGFSAARSRATKASASSSTSKDCPGCWEAVVLVEGAAVAGSLPRVPLAV